MAVLPTAQGCAQEARRSGACSACCRAGGCLSIAAGWWRATSEQAPDHDEARGAPCKQSSLQGGSAPHFLLSMLRSAACKLCCVTEAVSTPETRHVSGGLLRIKVMCLCADSPAAPDLLFHCTGMLWPDALSGRTLCAGTLIARSLVRKRATTTAPSRRRAHTARAQCAQARFPACAGCWRLAGSCCGLLGHETWYASLQFGPLSYVPGLWRFEK